MGVSCYALMSHLRLAGVELLPRSGKQPPMMKPRATAPARTSPHGRSIDFQNTNLRLTKLAFWTDISAIVTIQNAAIVEITKLTITATKVVLPPKPKRFWGKIPSHFDFAQ